jgi:hypothetical protein
MRWLDASLGEALLDRFDDGAHLSVVRRRTQHKGIGDGQLIAHIERDDIDSELVGRSGCGLSYEMN